MATMTMTMTVLFAIFAAGNVESATPSNAPAPAVDCSALVTNMAACLSYVSSGNTVKKPDAGCCDGLKTVVKTDADCLCESFKSIGQLGLNLNMTKVMSLPSACKVSVPSLGKCGVSLSPGAAPAMSPAGAMFPSGGAPSTGPNVLAPAPAPGGSAALSISVGSLVIALVVASLYSI